MQAYPIRSRSEATFDHLGLCNDIAVGNPGRLGQASGTTGSAISRYSGRTAGIVGINGEPVTFTMIQELDESLPTSWYRMVTFRQNEDVLIGNMTRRCDLCCDLQGRSFGDEEFGASSVQMMEQFSSWRGWVGAEDDGAGTNDRLEWRDQGAAD